MGDEYVGGLDVPVDYLLGVKVGEGVAELCGNLPGGQLIGRLKRSSLSTSQISLQPMVEVWMRLGDGRFPRP